VYKGNELLFISNKDGLLPLIEYIEGFSHYHRVVIFDKIIGNAAALLTVKANCKEVFSPLGSQLAIKTMIKYHIRYHFLETVPSIQKLGVEDICPMEKLSLNKEPEEFYELIKDTIQTH
jgi:hypothetical protein